MTLIQEVDAIVERCSRYSGWVLQWEIKGTCLDIWDPKDYGKSYLSVSLGVSGCGLYEVYGRLRHWAITVEEQSVLIRMLQHSVLEV